MKLMPTAQLQDKKAQDLAKELLRIDEINKASDKARKDLANAESDFKATLARQRLQWAQGEEEHAKRTKDMTSEVLALEKRKEQALIPISMYKQEADEIYRQAQEVMVLAKEKESDVDDIRTHLETRLDEVGEREQNLLRRERDIASRLIGIESQNSITVARSKDLTQAWLQFNQTKAQADKEIFTQKEELTLKERSFLAKEEELKRTQESLRQLEVQLKDERGTLERAFARLKKPLSPLPEDK